MTPENCSKSRSFISLSRTALTTITLDRSRGARECALVFVCVYVCDSPRGQRRARASCRRRWRPLAAGAAHDGWR
jgi:hypothetical protein